MDTLITILSLLGVLIVLVMAHECGHFFTARFLGVKVDEFGLFFPPRIYGYKRGETIYSINALPIGGFVKMAGEEDPDIPGSLASKKPWVRMVVLAAGSFMNAILPIILFAVAFMIPHNVLSGQVMVTGVGAESPAEQAGIVAGDTVLEIDGHPIRNIGDANRYIQLKLGDEVSVMVEHADSSRDTYQVMTRWQPPQDQGATGMNLSLGPVIVADVEEGSASAEAGIMPGDVVREIDGNRVNNSYDYITYLGLDNEEGLAAGKEIDLVIERSGILQNISLVPRFIAAENITTTGMFVNSPSVRESDPFWEAIPGGVRECYETYVLYKNAIISMIVGTAPATVAGPVGIAQITGEAARAGFSYLLQFAAFFSINLAIINIFPLPALDGGRMAFVLLEWIRRGKRVSPRIEGIIHTVGFFLLIAAMVAITYQDIVRLIAGESLIP